MRGRTNKGEVVDPSNVKVVRSGVAGKAGKHEGPAGAGEVRDLGSRKFNKEGRDNAGGEKERGKSRGPGG